MANATGKTGGQKAPLSKEDRLKAALKANMAKRKAQARARSLSEGQRGKKAD